MADQVVTVQENSPTFPTGPEGAEALTLWAYPELFSVPEGTTFTTIDFTMVLPFDLTPDAIRTIAGGLRSAVGVLGGTLVAYGVWRTVGQDVTVPDRICIADQCIGPLPMAGQTVAVVSYYTFWAMIANDRVQASAYARPVIQLGILTIVALVVGALILAPALIGVMQVLTGQLTYQQYLGGVRDIWKAPGDAIGGVTTGWIPWAFAGLGLTMATMAIALPAINSQVSATVPIGGALVTAGAGTGRPAPASSKRKP